jgi:hypothetical protein
MSRIRALEKMAMISHGQAQRVIQLARELGIRQTRGDGAPGKKKDGRRRKRRIVREEAPLPKKKAIKKRKPREGKGPAVKKAKYGPEDADALG